MGSGNLNNIGRKSQLDTRELLLLQSEVQTHGKDMTVAYVLWFFLGILGAHRFYMGKSGTAVLQLILTLTFFGAIISGIWWLIDVLLVHSWVKEHNWFLENRIIDHLAAQRTFVPGQY